MEKCFVYSTLNKLYLQVSKYIRHKFFYVAFNGSALPITTNNAIVKARVITRFINSKIVLIIFPFIEEKIVKFEGEM